MNVALPPVQSIDRNAILLAALEQGRAYYERGWSRSACRNQDEEAGYDAAAGLPLEGFLQTTIDYAAELEELQDGIEDNIWHSRGGW